MRNYNWVNWVNCENKSERNIRVKKLSEFGVKVSRIKVRVVNMNEIGYNRARGWESEWTMIEKSVKIECVKNEREIKSERLSECQRMWMWMWSERTSEWVEQKWVR